MASCAGERGRGIRPWRWRRRSRGRWGSVPTWHMQKRSGRQCDGGHEYGRNPMFKHGQEDARGPRTYGMDGMAPSSERTGRRRLRKRHFTIMAAAIAGAVLLPAGSAMATSAALVPSTFVVITQGVAFPANSDPGAFINARCPAGTRPVAAGAIALGNIKGLSIQDSPAETAFLDTNGGGPGGGAFALAQATCAPSAQLAGSHLLT